MVGILVSYWEGLFSGAMLVSGRVCVQIGVGRNTGPTSVIYHITTFTPWKTPCFCWGGVVVFMGVGNGGPWNLRIFCYFKKLSHQAIRKVGMVGHEKRFQLDLRFDMNFFPKLFATQKVHVNLSKHTYALPETKSSPLKIGHSKGEISIPSIHFQVLCWF